MYTIQFVEAYVRDRERQLLAAARDSRARFRLAEAQETSRQPAEGGSQAFARQPCCTPAAA
jgi:hypothetical protein